MRSCWAISLQCHKFLQLVTHRWLSHMNHWSVLSLSPSTKPPDLVIHKLTPVPRSSLTEGWSSTRSLSDMFTSYNDTQCKWQMKLIWSTRLWTETCSAFFLDKISNWCIQGRRMNVQFSIIIRKWFLRNGYTIYFPFTRNIFSQKLSSICQSDIKIFNINVKYSPKTRWLVNI